MEYQIPLDAVPNQEKITNIGDQQCRLVVRTIDGNTFITIESEAQGYLCRGVLCVDRSAIIRADYLGFEGDFTFVDTDGEEPPHYTGFQDRWVLLYNTEGYPDYGSI